MSVRSTPGVGPETFMPTLARVSSSTGRLLSSIRAPGRAADSAAIADGWSTGLLVLAGNRSTRRLVEKAGLEVSVTDSSGREIETEGWIQFVSEERSFDR